MCYAGGPYCYTHSKERYDKAHEALKEKPTENNIKRFKDAVLQLDTTPQGVQKLAEKVSNEDNPEDKEHYKKRLAMAQKTAKAQSKNKSKTQSQKKLNEALDRIEEDSEPTDTGHINLTPKQANRLAKAELNGQFPDTKFSVREDKSSFFSSMAVTYNDPNIDAKEVHNTLSKYRGFSFDGQTDNYNAENGFSMRGRSMSTSLSAVNVRNEAGTDTSRGEYPNFTPDKYHTYQEVSSHHHTPYDEADREQKNVVNKWSANHDKEGNYIYRGPDHVSDSVSYDGTTYHRIGAESVDGGDYYPSEPYAFRVQVDKELTPEEADKLSNIAKYSYASTGGEKSYYEDTIQDSPNSVILHLDTTKNRAYRRLDKFFDNIKGYSREGTPSRKDGTKALDGLEGFKNVEIYADHTTYTKNNPR